MSARTSGASVTPRATRSRVRDRSRPDAARAGRAEGAGVPPGAAPDVEHPPAGPEPGGPADQRDRPLRLGLVPMGIELEVLLTEPLLEPFGHGERDQARSLVIRLARRMVNARYSCSATTTRASSCGSVSGPRLQRAVGRGEQARAPARGPADDEGERAGRHRQRSTRRASSSLVHAARRGSAPPPSPPPGSLARSRRRLPPRAGPPPWAPGSPPASRSPSPWRSGAAGAGSRRTPRGRTAAAARPRG